jgi:hypothetical protein
VPEEFMRDMEGICVAELCEAIINEDKWANAPLCIFASKQFRPFAGVGADFFYGKNFGLQVRVPEIPHAQKSGDPL